MQVELRVEGLPADALAAAGAFYGEWLDRAHAALALKRAARAERVREARQAYADRRAATQAGRGDRG